MTRPELLIFDSLDDLSAAAAEQFAAVVSAAAAVRGAVAVALSGGSTPLVLFHRLAQAPYQQSLPWRRIHFFWGDERCVPPEDPESNYGQAFQALLAPAAVPAENMHRALGELEPEAAAADYARQLAHFAADFPRLADPSGAWPRLDLALMGLGADGHTASLFPSQMHPMEANASVIAVTADYQGRPANRVTLTPRVFNDTRQVTFMATGEAKAAALSAVLHGLPDALTYPAQRIQPVDGKVTWMVDRAAAGKMA
jgi:6-phosphogluconolactonase